MTTKEFKDKFPQYAHLEGYALWNAMEDSFLHDSSREAWVADYSEGFVEEYLHTMPNGIKVCMKHNNYWVNSHTKERITNDEFRAREEAKYPKRDLSPIESFKMGFLDFSTNPPSTIEFPYDG